MEAELKNLIYDALSLVVMTLLPVLLGYLAAWLRERYGVERLQRASHTLAVAAEIAHKAVAAIELISATQGWSSPTKRAGAILQAKHMALQHALKLTDAQWETLIEAAVKSLKDFDRELKRPEPAQ